MIHYEYRLGSLFFTDGAVEAELRALKTGCDIITDTAMALSGVSKSTLAKCSENGAQIRYFLASEDMRATLRSDRPP